MSRFRMIRLRRMWASLALLALCWAQFGGAFARAQADAAAAAPWQTAVCHAQQDGAAGPAADAGAPAKRTAHCEQCYAPPAFCAATPYALKLPSSGMPARALAVAHATPSLPIFRSDSRAPPV